VSENPSFSTYGYASYRAHFLSVEDASHCRQAEQNPVGHFTFIKNMVFGAVHFKRQLLCCGSGSALILDGWIGIRIQVGPTHEEKSEGVPRPSWRPRDKYIADFHKKHGFFPTVKYTFFGPQISGSGFALTQKAGSGFTLKQMRIHSMASCKIKKFCTRSPVYICI
jgi:hypothetical protein